MSLRLVALLMLLISIAAAETPRVFITDSQSWEVRGSAGGANGAFGATAAGGARPQTAEIIKTFGERCPQVTVNNKQEKADYVVVLDHEGGKGLLRKKNKVAVFNRDGDSIVSHSTLSLGGSVEDACNAIDADWKKSGGKRAAEPEPPKKAEIVPERAPEVVGAKLRLASTPDGADIEVNGNFVGSTPSTINLAAGDYAVAIKKTGYKSWERKIKLTGGDINLNAELEKNP